MRAVLTGVALVCMLAVGRQAFAAGLQPSEPPPLPGFVVAGDQTGMERLPAAPLVLAAYAFVWVAVLFYVWLTWRRLAKVEGEMRELAKKAVPREP